MGGWGSGWDRTGRAEELLGAQSDDLDDGKEDNRRGWELQHGRDIGSYFARGGHPVKRIVA